MSDYVLPHGQWAAFHLGGFCCCAQAFQFDVALFVYSSFVPLS